ALAVIAILAEADEPGAGVNCVVTLEAKEFAAALMADPRLPTVCFAGSTPVDHALQPQAAYHLQRTSTELPGTAPFLLLTASDIATAVDAAMRTKFRNNGEACTAANRFYLHYSIPEEFTAGFVERTSQLVLGPGADPAPTLGPLLDEAGIAKVQELQADAVER